MKPKEQIIVSKAFKTEQEEFWAGAFGNEYIERNNEPCILSNKLALWTKIIDKMQIRGG